MSTPQSIHRYPGIQPFSRQYKSVFFGRAEDIEKLYKYLNVNNLVVIYGKSGLGKSSLLNAGLIPAIEKHQDNKTIFIRFGSYSANNSKKLRDVFFEKIKEALPENSSVYLSDLGIEDQDRSLWQYLKTLAWEYRKKDGILLVLDQFEEVFTYPEEEVNQFGQEFSEVVNDRMPVHFRVLLYKKHESDTSFLKRNNKLIDFLDDPQSLKILIGIRSDRLSLLDRFSAYLPNILRNTYELKPLDILKASQAITIPALKKDEAGVSFLSPPFTYEDALLKAILSYLSKNGTRSVETFLLQIICQHIEDRVIANLPKEDQNIEVHQTSISDLDTIVREYYINIVQGEDTVSKQPNFAKHDQLLVRYFIESNLIDSIHHNRISLDKALVEQKGFHEELLKKLINARIIRQEPNTVSGISYELSHDTLIDPVLHSEHHLGKLDEQIDAYYRKRVNQECQQYIEQHLLTLEGQPKRLSRKLANTSTHPELLIYLTQEKIVRELTPSPETPPEYALYDMFSLPARKLRTEREGQVLKGERTKRRRATGLAIVAAMFAIVAILASVLAYQQTNVAQENTYLAEIARENEAIQRQLAEREMLLADSLRDVANKATAEEVVQKNRAIAARKEAEKQRKIAEEQREQARSAESRSEELRETAVRAYFEADKQRIIALGEEKKALAALNEARQQKALAENRLEEILNQTKIIEVQPFITRARDILRKDATVALRIAEYAYQLQQIDSTEQFLYQLIGNPDVNFYRTPFPDFKPRSMSISGFHTSLSSISFASDSACYVWNRNMDKLFVLPEYNVHGDVSSSGNYFWTTSKDKSDSSSVFKVWDSKGKLVNYIQGNYGFFLPGEERVLVNTIEGIKLWNLRSQNLDLDIKRIYMIGLPLPNNKYLLVEDRNENRKIKLLHLETGQVTNLIERLNLKDRFVFVEFSSNNNYILVSSPDAGEVKLLDLRGKLIASFTEPEIISNFSPDGKYIQTFQRNSGERNKVWDISGKLLHTFEGSKGMFSPNMQYFITYDQFSYDNMYIKLWKANSDSLIRTCAETKFTLAFFSQDNTSIFTCDFDETIKEWDILHSPIHRKIIDSYQKDLPFRDVKVLVEKFLTSSEVARLTAAQKQQYGIKD